MSIIDAFTGTNGTGIVAYSSNWAYNVGSGTDLQIQSNGLTIRQALSLEIGARRTETGFPNDQFAQVTVAAAAAASSQVMGVSVRGAGTRYYGFYADNVAGSQLFKYDGTTWTQLGANGANFAATDTIKLQVAGTTLTPIKNGATLSPPGAQTDATYANGAPGVAAFNNNEVVNLVRIDDFQSTDAGVQAPLATAKPLLMTLQRDTSQLRAMPIPSYLRDSITPDIVPPIPGNTQHPILSAFERRFGRMPMGRIAPVLVAPTTASVLAAPGDASASFIGQSTAASTLSAPGDSTATFVGASTAAAVLSAAADASASFVGKALDAAVLSAPGDASATFVGRSTAASVLAAPADSTAAFVGRSDAAAVWAASASATGDFVGTAQVAGDSTLSASGDSTGIFVGQSLAASVLEAVADSNANWRGDFTVPVDTSIDGSGIRFTGRGRAARKRTPEDIAREQKMVQEYLDELERKEALAQVPGAATPGTQAAEAGSQGVEPATSVKGTEVASPAPVLHAVARVNALQRMAELEEEALEAERNEQQQQRRRAAASAVLLMSY